MKARASLALLCTSMTLAAVPAAGQARIEAVTPENARVAVQRLGAATAAPPAIAMELLPGDVIAYGRDSVLVELSCKAGEKQNRYLLSSPFRVLIDVPSDSSCHVNVLAGRTEVVAEAPTQTSAGGVTLGSSGTQYSIEVTRSREGVVLKCMVFDGAVEVRGRRRGIVASAGSKLLWTAERPVVRTPNTEEEIDRAASVYARFDLATAQRASPVADSAAAYEQLKTLHYQVLANPADTAKRVELAKRQLQYNVTDRAVYNLRRADVTTEAKARRYQLDPAVLRRNAIIRGGYERR